MEFSQTAYHLMAEKGKTWARVQMLLIATVFLGPLLVAAIMYYGGTLQPQGRTNHGVLLQPIVNLTEQVPDSLLTEEVGGRWALLYTHDGECAANCRESLLTIRQMRRMLGKDMERVVRVFLHSDSSLDTVFLADEHAGLIALTDNSLRALLNNKKPALKSGGGYFLIDPLGNLVMYFEPTIDPGDTVEDIRHLLKFSHIG